MHRPDLAGLTAQVEGYGTGLTAFYTALVVSRPSIVWRLLRLAPRAVRDVLGTASSEETLPPELAAVKRRGMLTGPVRYLGERRRVWAAAGRTP
jgi:Na+/H+-dicarboxylate symporter